jgi:DNA-binding transcriptional ArsR family regulator
MITLSLPPRAAEQVDFRLSPLAEAVHSWHVLAEPAHHALQLPWVRRCRSLPSDLRADLRRWSWLVRDYVPALFEAGSGTFDDELRGVAKLAPADVSAELAEAVRVNQPDEPELWLDRVRTEPMELFREVLDVLRRYWETAFADEWASLEPRLDAAASTASSRGVLSVLRDMRPAIGLGDHEVILDRPHHHTVHAPASGPIVLTPSFYAWPHVRVTCDEPWPLRLTYPVVPVSRRGRRSELLSGLRALASEPRLAILHELRDQPRSTQELSGLLDLAGPAVSRHLQQLLQAELVRTRREGYYQLYELRKDALCDLADQLRTLADN